MFSDFEIGSQKNMVISMFLHVYLVFKIYYCSRFKIITCSVIKEYWVLTALTEITLFQKLIMGSTILFGNNVRILNPFKLTTHNMPTGRARQVQNNHCGCL